MNPAEQQSTGSTGGMGGGMGQTGQTGQGDDALDKGVNMLEQKFGHTQKPGTTEKVNLIFKRLD